MRQFASLNALVIGRDLARLPDAANSALASACATGGTPGSPRPPESPANLGKTALAAYIKGMFTRAIRGEFREPSKRHPTHRFS